MDLKVSQKKKSFDLNSGINLPLDYTSHKIGDTFLFIAPGKASLIIANETGKKIIDRLYSGLTIKEVINSLKNEGLALSTIERDIHDILVKVEQKGFYEDAVVIEPDNPPTLHLDITNQCNLTCVHCIRNAGKKEKEELETADWLKIIDAFASTFKTHVTISGGEPLLHPGLFEIINRAKYCGLSITLFTNGTIMNNDIINRLVGVIEKIQISIDGASESVHDNIRGNGSFKKVLETISLINKTDIVLDIAISAMPGNLDDLYGNMKSLTDKIGPKANFRISQVVKIGRANSSHIFKSKEETNDLINYMYEKRLRAPGKYDKNVKMNNCGYGETITISCIGDIYPCSIYDDVVKYGNVKKNNFEEILKNITEDREKYSIKNMKQCSACDLRNICCGGCRVNNILLAGGILNPECTTRKNFKENMYSHIVSREKKDPLTLWLGKSNEDINKSNKLGG